ncbi:histidine--tRNA ligase [Thiomicrospira sp. ALE5]|uniref:histidine--tRNA ligase n=1 Tax=Thiomicrospira sp. ALE5 TaxID=748650 RepID=UPI0008F04E9C|nr:histidine--tRNA ligase [Thiomicrospira sp. ALE5]SFR63191.1 histidyl-tRNA synthetase [Thiomicrospira sp. ALE5]
MATKLTAIRGMNDYIQEDAAILQYLVRTAEQVLNQYAYHPVFLPVVEKTALFSRAIGEVTDIVEKEMYTFDDRNGDSLSLRPEGTAGCVRAMIENGMLYNQTQKVYYYGPMFRHERPQKGRYRQFNQFGVEVFGLSAAEVDAELIAISARLWDQLGFSDFELQLNSLGSSEARSAYKKVLTDYFKAHLEQLDEDSLRRLDRNPLRILDSKNPAMAELILNAPKLIDHLDSPSQEHFAKLCSMLDDLGIAYRLNTNLVRGLDYYNQTVFEWTTDKLGAQATVCAGGRYDGLVSQIGGQPTSAVGFAMGLERLMVLLKESQFKPKSNADIYMVVAEEKAIPAASLLCESLRDHFTDLRVVMHSGGGSLKSQFKKADKSGARFALVLGDSELASQTLQVKALREEGAQETIAWNQLITHISTRIK